MTYQLLYLTMSSKIALLFLLMTNVHGGPVPPLSQFIDVNHESPVMVNTINTAIPVNFFVSGITVLISWISFLIPPSHVQGRLAVLLTSFVVKMGIVNSSFTNASTSEEIIKVRVPVLPLCFRRNVFKCFNYVTQFIGRYLSIEPPFSS